MYHLSYFTPVKYLAWHGKGQKRIIVSLEAFQCKHVLDGYQVHVYAAFPTCPSLGVVVDAAFLKKFPALLADGGPE